MNPVNLYCASCDVPHDLDLSPDEGTCLICGGPLIQDEIEREVVQGSGNLIVNAVSDGLLKANLLRGKSGPGNN